MDTTLFIAVAAPIIGLTLIAVLVSFLKKHLHICEPHELLIISGRTHKTAGGREVGYRVIHGGRGISIPIVEKVDQMDMSLISVPMTIRGAYSEGGIPLNVHAIANVKVSDDPRVVGNAIERFLGHSTGEIARVAKETLEGHLRGVIAAMTPEEMNEDRLKFAERLQQEAAEDLKRLGLQLDVLKIQHVSDDRNYLDSIGRTRIAEIVRAAEVAESDASRAAAEAEAESKARGGVAKTNAQAIVQKKKNELRQVKAELDAKARSEEERAEAAALQARAHAEKELQGIRSELEALRLTADVTLPAQIDRKVAELNAEGRAAAIEARGRAIAAAFQHVAGAYEELGDDAMELVVVQHLEQLVAEASNIAMSMRAEDVSLVDGGEGDSLASYAQAYPATVNALLGQLGETLGVDITGVLKGRPVEKKPVPKMPELDAA
jgi:flotillin